MATTGLEVLRETTSVKRGTGSALRVTLVERPQTGTDPPTTSDKIPLLAGPWYERTLERIVENMEVMINHQTHCSKE